MKVLFFDNEMQDAVFFFSSKDKFIYIGNLVGVQLEINIIWFSMNFQAGMFRAKLKNVFFYLEG